MGTAGERRPPLSAGPGPEVTDMRLVAAVLAVVSVLLATSCAPAQRVDLGRDAGYLIAAISGEPDQLDPQKTSAYLPGAL